MNTCYHIYNHAIGTENLFRDQGNYEYFLQKIKKYLLYNSDLLSFCLMPNHFHLLISTEAPYESIKNQSTKMTISYAKSYNKLFNRMGSLFLRACKIKPIGGEVYTRTVIMYIHRNPIHHGFEHNYNGWIYSSYNDICTFNTEYVNISKTLAYFGDLSQFKSTHQAYRNNLPGMEAEMENY